MGIRRLNGRDGRDMPRAANGKPPCWKCPKGGPQNEKHATLSEKNQRTFELYLKVRATKGKCLTGRMATDALLAGNLAQIELIYETWLQSQAVAGVARLGRAKG